jgi:hypothetical protein
MFLVSLVLGVSVDHTIFETTINRGATSLLYKQASKQASKLTSDPEHPSSVYWFSSVTNWNTLCLRSISIQSVSGIVRRRVRSCDPF